MLGYRLGEVARRHHALAEASGFLSGHELGLHLSTAYRVLQERFNVPSGFPQHLLECFAEFDAELKAENHWVSLEGAMKEAAVSPHWQHPPSASAQAILIDTPESLTPVQQRLLIRSIEAWLSAGKAVVVTLIGMHSMDSGDVFEFFDGQESASAASRRGANDPGQGVRKALFESFLQKGIGRVVWCGDGSDEELDFGNDRKTMDLPVLTDGVSSSSTELLQHAADTVGVYQPTSEWEEVLAIGADLKPRLLRGDFSPGEAIIAVPELPRYAPLILAMAEDFGLPVDFSSAAHLVRHPIGTALAALLRLSQAGAEPEDYLDLVCASPMRSTLPIPPEQVLTHLRAARVRRAWPKAWLSDIVEWNTSQSTPVDLTNTRACIEAIVELDNTVLLPIRRGKTPKDLVEKLPSALQHLGFPSGRSDSSGEAAGAWKAVLDLLQQTESLAHQLPGTPEARDWLLRELMRQLRQTTFRTSPPQSGAVRVLGALELRGQKAQYIWFAGLARGAYPSARSPHPLIPGPTWRSIQTVVPAAEARSQFQTLLREALLGSHVLRLSWPQIRAGKTSVPAPALREFLDHFENASCSPLRASPDSKRLSKRIQVSTGAGLTPEASEIIALQKARTEAMSQPLSFFEGLTGRSTKLSDGVAVTRLERYIICPARDWYSKILKLTDSDQRQEDATPLTVGSLLHRVLELFVERHSGDYLKTGISFESMAKPLAIVAEEVLTQESIQPSLSADGLADLREKWLPGLLDSRPKGILATWLGQELSRLPERYPLEVEAKVEGLQVGGVKIRGRVDRVDAVGPDGSLIIDYKSGSTPDIADLKSGLAIQGLLYGEWARKKWPERTLVASVYSRVGKPDDMKERSWMGEASLLTKHNQRSKVVLTEDARHRHLDHVGKSLAALQAGVHHPTLAKPEKAGCEHCAYHRICRFDETRANLLPSDSRSVGPMEVE